MKIFKRSILLPLLLASFTINCGEDDDHHDLEPAIDGCEHMIEGPSEAITASATADAAPSVSAPHRRYDIALDGGEGFVSFDADEEAEFYFFVNESIGLEITDSAGGVVAVEEQLSSVDECTEVASASIFDLDAGSYTLHFTGGGAEIQMVPFEAAEHDHE